MCNLIMALDTPIFHAFASFQKKRGVHRGQFLGDCGCNQLVEAGAVGLGASYDFGFLMI